MEKQLEKLRRDAETISRHVLDAANARQAVLRHVRRLDDRICLGDSVCHFPPDRRVWVLGAGKASASMALGIEEVLQDRITGGLIIVKYGHTHSLQRIEIAEAGHPLPDDGSVTGTQRLLRLIEDRVCADDLVLCLLSGGGSALLEAPADGVSLTDLIIINELLITSGASIHEINAVRKHLSAVKGGQLVRHLPGCETWTLILSDVPGDDLDVIASGPTVPDGTTFMDAWSVITKYGLALQAPSSAASRIRKGLAGELPDTPKSGDGLFERQHHLIIGSNALACRAAAKAAEALGYDVRVRPAQVTLDNEVFAQEEMCQAAELADLSAATNRPVCFISGGETTIRLQGKGKGGRNQDLVLRCVAELSRLECPTVFLSLGTDGTDGPTDAAGAVADNLSLSRHQSASQQPLMEYVTNNDSYHFFESLGDLLKTGPTGTNVMDVHLLLISPPP